MSQDGGPLRLRVSKVSYGWSVDDGLHSRTLTEDDTSSTFHDFLVGTGRSWSELEFHSQQDRSEFSARFAL